MPRLTDIPQAMAPIEYHVAQRLVWDYLCSGCWSPLYMTFAPKGKYVVKCSQCEDKTPGYVSRYWGEMKEQEATFEAREVRRAYPELFDGG